MRRKQVRMIKSYLQSVDWRADLMNTYFAIAAAFAVFNAGLHFFLGGKTIARLLLEATSLDDKVRCVQYFC